MFARALLKSAPAGKLGSVNLSTNFGKLILDLSLQSAGQPSLLPRPCVPSLTTPLPLLPPVVMS
jgi:hypothetical protein